MKLKIQDILKPGAKLTARKLDCNSPKLKRQLKELEKQQDECLRNKHVDWDALSRMYITI